MSILTNIFIFQLKNHYATNENKAQSGKQPHLVRSWAFIHDLPTSFIIGKDIDFNSDFGIFFYTYQTNLQLIGFFNKNEEEVQSGAFAIQL